jgi:surfactin synthase thioesterase subunit
MKENDWLLPIKVPQKVKRLLLTFHYAASSAAIFYAWKELLDEDTMLYAIELPGRGTRYEEEPVSDLKTIVLKIAESITPHLGNVPITIFGHSMGGILGFETASILLTENKYAIEQLIMSAVTPLDIGK